MSAPGEKQFFETITKVSPSLDSRLLRRDLRALSRVSNRTSPVVIVVSLSIRIHDLGYSLMIANMATVLRRRPHHGSWSGYCRLLRGQRKPGQNLWLVKSANLLPMTFVAHMCRGKDTGD